MSCALIIQCDSPIKSKYIVDKGNDTIDNHSKEIIRENNDIKVSIDGIATIGSKDVENKNKKEYNKLIYDKKVDDELWNIVLKNNNLENYKSYIEGCIIKLHLEEAKRRVDDIIKNNQDNYYKNDIFDEVKKQLELQRIAYSSKYYEEHKGEKAEKIKIKEIEDKKTPLKKTKFGRTANKKIDNKKSQSEETRKLAAKYYEDKDRKSAYVLYERLANENDIESIKMMAHIYTVGDKVDINYEKHSNGMKREVSWVILIVYLQWLL